MYGWVDNQWQLASETLNIYDANTVYTQAPTLGMLKASRTLVQGNQYIQASFGYDNWGNRTSTTSYAGYGSATQAPTLGARSNSVVFDPVLHSYPVTLTDEMGHITSLKYEWDKYNLSEALGVPTSETDPNNVTTTASYDGFGRIIQLIKPGDDSTNPTMKFGYVNLVDGFKTTVEQRIDTSRYVWVERIYDGMGRQTLLSRYRLDAEKNPYVSKIKTEYVSPVLVKQSQPYTGNTPNFNTTITTDFANQTTTVSQPDGTTSITTVNGLSSTVQDAMGNKTTSWQDVWGRTVSVVPPSGPAVAYAYDPSGLLQIVTRGGVSTTLNYDKLGRKTSMSDPDMGQWYYYYDAQSNLISQVDAKGQISNLFYDPLNRLVGKTYPLAQSFLGDYPQLVDPGPGNYEVENQYDGFVNGLYDSSTLGVGRRTFMRDGSGSTVWKYDPRGRLTSETKKIKTGETAPFTFDYLTSWTYNSADLPQSMTYPGGEKLTYGYGLDGTLESFINSNSTGDTYLQDAQYDVAGRLTNMKFGINVISKTLAYYPWNTADMGGLLESATAATLGSSPISLQNLSYTYDKNGNVRTIVDALAANGTQTQDFTYDVLDRINTAGATGGSDGLYYEEYAYNDVSGNLSLKNGLTYSYDPAHPHAVSSLSNGNFYTYDANGNMTLRSANEQDFALDYDSENRMVKVSIPEPAVVSSTLAGPNPTRASTVQFRVAFSKHVTNVDAADFALVTSGVTGASVGTVNWSGTAYTVTVNTGTGSGTIRLDIPAGASILDLDGAALTGLPYTTGQTYTLDRTPPTVVSSVRATSSPSSAAANQFIVSFSEPVTGVDRTDFSLTTSGVTNAAVSLVSGSGSLYTVTVKSQGNGTIRLNVLDDNTILDAVSNQLGGPVSGDGNFMTGAVYSVTKSGSDTTGIFRASTGSFYLKNSNVTGAADVTISFGQAGDTPIAGDWDGNGTVTVGLYRNGSFILHNTNTPGSADLTVIFGLPGDQPLAGDWNGDGIDTIGVYRSSTATFFLRNSNTSGAADVVISFGNPGDVGIVGDWNADGMDTIGLFRPSSGIVYLKNTNTTGYADITFNYGMAGDKPLAGDWNDDGIDSIGIYRNGIFYLRNTNTAGFADISFGFGISGDLPIMGNWDAVGVPGGLAPQMAGNGRTVTPPIMTGQQAANFESADFWYDGDGKRVKSVMTTDVGVTTTYFVSNYYEVTDGVVTKYYYAGGQRIAVRKANTLNYIIGDHLGSTSIVTDDTGGFVSKTQYKAWGEVRSSTGTETTKYQFTGQFSYASDFGLLFFNARWVDPYITHFTSPDTIIPDNYNTLDFDRYQYARSNPLKYTDPSGHDPTGNCYDKGYCDSKNTWSSIVRPAPVVILACGDVPSCKPGTPGSLDLYEKLSPNVYRVPLGGWYGGVKYDSASSIQEIVNAYPSSPAIIVGHSAGGDAATLAYSNLLDAQKEQTELILLDPTMSAGTHDPSLPGETDYSQAGSMVPLIKKNAEGVGHVFIYDSNKDGIVLSTFGLNTNATNYSYVYQPGIGHMPMAGTGSQAVDAFNLAVSILGITIR